MDPQQIKSVFESLIFVSDEPITLAQLAKLIGRKEKKELRDILDELKEEYISRHSGIELVEVAGGYQFRTTAENSKWVTKLFEERPQRLTRASLETLAIIAYRQPIVRQEVERIRGVDSGGVIKTLLERNLVKIVGRQDVPGRPVMYGTTTEFLEFFGLKNLLDLPPLRDIAELGDATEEFIAEYADRENAAEAGIPYDPETGEPAPGTGAGTEPEYNEDRDEDDGGDNPADDIDDDDDDDEEDEEDDLDAMDREIEREMEEEDDDEDEE